MADDNMAAALPGVKFCPGCAQTKPVKDFGPRRQSPDGLRPRCRPCRNTDARQAYYADLDESRRKAAIAQKAKYAKDRAASAAKAKAYRDSRRVPKAPPSPEEAEARAAELLQRKRDARKRTYEKNKAKVLAQAAEYRAAHKVEEKMNRRAHYERNREKVAQVTKAYREANPSLYAAAFAKRRATKRNATPAWADERAMASIYAEAARITRETGLPHEVDHIVPLQSPLVCGLHVPCNLRIVTREVNRRKSNSWSIAA